MTSATATVTATMTATAVTIDNPSDDPWSVDMVSGYDDIDFNSDEGEDQYDKGSAKKKSRVRSPKVKTTRLTTWAYMVVILLLHHCLL